MKPTLLPTLCCLCVSVSLASAEDSTQIPRKPPTHAELAQKKADLARKSPVKVATDQKPLVVTKKRSLLATSTLLASGNHWTLVPRGSVIHVPDRYRDKIVSKPTGQLLEWDKFLRKNQGWLQTHAVTMKEAQGKKRLSEETKKAYQSIGKVIIATCANGPITLAKEPAKPKADANNAATGGNTGS